RKKRDIDTGKKPNEMDEHQRRMNWLKAVALATAAGLLCAMPQTAPAATFTWIPAGNASGSWNTPGNWSGAGTLPTTINDTANFNNVDITADSTVTLDGNQSIGVVVFGNTAPTPAANWILNPGALNLGGSTLTLGVASPAITVNNLGAGESAIINAAL